MEDSEIFTTGAELCRYFSQGQLSDILGIPPAEVLLVGSKPLREEVDERLAQRVDYLLEVSKIVEGFCGANGVAQWFSVPHADIDHHIPVSAFLGGEWEANDVGTALIRRLALWEASCHQES